MLDGQRKRLLRRKRLLHAYHTLFTRMRAHKLGAVLRPGVLDGSTGELSRTVSGTNSKNFAANNTDLYKKQPALELVSTSK